jgi:hypothetical protein
MTVHAVTQLHFLADQPRFAHLVNSTLHCSGPS